MSKYLNISFCPVTRKIKKNKSNGYTYLLAQLFDFILYINRNVIEEPFVFYLLLVLVPFLNQFCRDNRSLQLIMYRNENKHKVTKLLYTC